MFTNNSLSVLAIVLSSEITFLTSREISWPIKWYFFPTSKIIVCKFTFSEKWGFYFSPKGFIVRYFRYFKITFFFLYQTNTVITFVTGDYVALRFGVYKLISKWVLLIISLCILPSMNEAWFARAFLFLIGTFFK